MAATDSEKRDVFYYIGKGTEWIVFGLLALIMVAVLGFIGTMFYNDLPDFQPWLKFLTVWGTSTALLGFVGLLMIGREITGYRDGGMYISIATVVGLLMASAGWFFSGG